MDVVEYEPGLLRGICELYNSTIAPVALCHRVDPPHFEEALAPALVTDSQGPDNMRAQSCFAVLDGDRVVGFGSAGLLVDSAERVEGGAIRFLSYEPGRRSVGLSLLDRIEEWLADLGAASVTAFSSAYRFPFYHHSSARLSDRIGHVQALLVGRGYERCGGEVYLEWEGFPPRDPEPLDVALEITLEEQPGHGKLPGLTNTARVNGEQIGERTLRASGAGEGPPAWEDRVFVYWVGVEETWQGKRIGKHLLQRSLNDAHALGFRQAGISTGLSNKRGFSFYSNFGFSVWDWTYEWGRQL